MDHLLGLTGLSVAAAAACVLALRHPRLSVVLTVGVGVRIAAALCHAYITPLPDSFVDVRSFELQAWEWGSQGFLYTLQQFPGADAHFYTFLIALTYSVTDRSPLLIQSFSVLAGTLGVYFTWRAAYALADETCARRAAWVAALFPTLILYSALTLREAFIFLALMIAIYHVIQWQRTKHALYCASSLASLLAGVYFHGGMFIALIVLVTIFGLHYIGHALREISTSRIRAIGTILALLLAGAVALLFLDRIAIPKLGDLGRMMDLARWTGIMESRAYGGAAYPEALLPTHPADLAWLLPVRIFYLLFAPFPWDVYRLGHIIGLLDGLLYMAMFAFIVAAVRRRWTDPAYWLILLLLLPLVLAFAVGTGNFGAAIRHRAKFAGVLIVLAARALPTLRWRQCDHAQPLQETLPRGSS